MLPLGHVISDKGEFDVDEESLQSMNAQIAKRGVDLVIDYEHQTLNGGRAPAAGWVKALMLKNGSIQARVEWTPAATNYLKNREYRYLSPVITVRKDGKATGLHSLALTNTPAIEGMTPLVNSQNFGSAGRPDSDDELGSILRICKRLGVSPEDITQYSGIGATPGPGTFKRYSSDDATELICERLGVSKEDLAKYGHQS